MAGRTWRRKNTRLRGYDYSLPGAYFVTICTEHRQPLFGTVAEGVVQLSPVGEMVAEQWRQLPGRFPGVDLDAMVIMPDHLHGIVILGTDPDVMQLPQLGRVMADFKGRTTNRYIHHVKSGDWAPFRDRVWQQRYIDRIIRDDNELAGTQDYIEANPSRWKERKNGTDM